MSQNSSSAEQSSPTSTPVPIVNPVSGTLKELSKAQFKELFDPSVHSAIDAAAARPGVEALILMESLDLGILASGRAKRSAVAVGPGCTYKLQDVANPNFQLGPPISTTVYPVGIYRI